jgi:hypothetical protein
MAKFLATFNDVIDEIELHGFIIMSEKEMNDYEELATSITWPFTYKLGEDQVELEYNSGEDLLSRIDFKEITNEESKMFKKLFNNEFGVFIDSNFLDEIAEEESDSDEEDEDYDDEDEDYDEY